MEKVYVIHCLEERDNCTPDCWVDSIHNTQEGAMERLKVLKSIDIMDMKNYINNDEYESNDFKLKGDEKSCFSIFNERNLDFKEYTIVEKEVETTHDFLQSLKDIVCRLGEVKVNNTGEKYLELDICDTGFSWTYWDDNETEYTDENGYIKVAQSIRIENDILKVVWDGGYKENLMNLNFDEDVSGLNCAACLYDYIMDWLLE